MTQLKPFMMVNLAVMLHSFSLTSFAGTPEEVETLKQQLQQLKQEYAQRFQELETRLKAAEEQTQAAQSSVQRAEGAATETARPTASNNSFNPAIGVVLNATYQNFSVDPTTYAIPGFILGGEAGLGEEGFSLGESELNLNANIDDQFYGNLTLALANNHEGETESELEEAFIQTLALPQGMIAKAGRFFSEIGYLNTHHTHTWDFADEPLSYRALLGKQYKEDGVQLRWVVPTNLLIELGGELFRGTSFPASGAAHGGVGAYNLFTHLGGDWGIEHSWQLGLSHLRVDAVDRADSSSVFNGNSYLSALDWVYKWAPEGNPKQRNFIFQTEYLYQKETGNLSIHDGTTFSVLDSTRQGFYAQAVYQFVPHWRAGFRYDRLWADNQGADFAVLEEAGLLPEDHKPQRYSVMADWSNSEFSRIRLQYNRDESRTTVDNQIILQYTMSLGAHGVHPF